ncbi:MAG: molybdopterin-dependent oxidoreductase, partial [Candidatus Bathyarchaeia archaeon]
GAKVIVIDPRFTETASIADLWLQIRPGSDVALGLAWLNTIINRRLYDRDFVENYTFGFDKLAERVQSYTPQWAERITWLPQQKIVEAAELYATNKPSCITWGVALDHLGPHAGVGAQTKALLRAITGNIITPGGNPLMGPHPNYITDGELELNEKLPPEQRAKQLGSDRFKLLAWPGYEILAAHTSKYWGKPPCAERTCQAHAPTVWRSAVTGKPYPVKALLSVANNPLVAFSNTKQVYEALTSPNLELHVVMDYFLTPSAMLADYVLPAASWLERPVLAGMFGLSDWFIASQRPAAPLYERRTDYEFWRELGLRLGQAEHWPWETLEEVNSYRVKPLGYDSYDTFVEEMRMHAASKDPRRFEEKGFATPTGKVELYSTVLEKLGYDPLPKYEELPETPFSTPITAKQYPLILIAGGNYMPYHHSEQRQVKLLRKMAPDPEVEINPTTASRYGVREGDWVVIETRRGKIQQRAKLTLGVDPRVICVQKGWWFPEQEGKTPSLFGLWKSTANVLTVDDPNQCDPICGSWYYRALLCKVYKAKE